MKLIRLSQGKFAKVDNEDFDRVSQFRWYLSHYKYAIRTTDKQSLSRFLLGNPKGLFVDHINHDTLDNRRQNLRLATPYQSVCNRRITSRNKCGVKGVYWDPDNGKWRADIRANKRIHHLGRFERIEDASKAYASAAVRLHGEFANP